MIWVRRNSDSFESIGDATTYAFFPLSERAAAVIAFSQLVAASPLAALSNHRLLDAILLVHPPIVEPAPVAHEERVDVLVATWAHTHDLILARLHHHVAALSAVRADRRRAIELPGAGLVQKILGKESADRTEIDDVGRPWVRHVAALELPDHGAVATLADVERRVVGDIVHEPDAASAKDAAVRHVDHVAAEILRRIEPLRLAVAGILAPFLVGVVLQLALAGLVADRTVERMVDEQHLEHALAGIE